MKDFLLRFGHLVAGVLHGFDRVVFRGKLRQLYAPEGMNAYCGRNRMDREHFKAHAATATKKVLEASLMDEAKRLNRYLYLNSGRTDKEAVAREIAAKHGVEQGLVCVLQCVEPCWTFDLGRNAKGTPTICGERGKCSHLYHYYIHPQFGWMYVRLQTWFPFEIQVGINGREWLARRMDQENLKYARSDNKFLWVEDWQRAQQLFNEQTQTDWVKELDALQKQVHPTHPKLLGRMPVDYNWTGFQSEFATDVAFQSEQMLQPCFDRWLRQAWLTYDSVDVLRFLGRTGKIDKKLTAHVQTSQHDYFEGKRIKHWVNHNSLKMYSHANVLRVEMTINQPEDIRVFRRSENDPKWPPMWRKLRWNVVDTPQRAAIGQQTNERYLETLSTLAETRTVQEIPEPLTRRAEEPRGPKPVKAPRYVRGLNPLKADDAALLVAISDPKWMVQGIKNRDLAAALYPDRTEDAKERRRRSNQVTRLLRLLRGHGLIEKIPKSHRYQVPLEARTKIQTLLAIRNANPDELTRKAA